MSGMPDIAAELAARCPGLTKEDIANAVSAAQFSPVNTPSETITPGQALLVSEFGDEGGAQGGVAGPGHESNYPEAFRCYYEDEEYKVQTPYVCTPSGTITATGDVAGQGSYYCIVKRTSGSDDTATYSAEITSDISGGPSSEDEETVVTVPLFNIMSNGEILQHHVGVIVVAGASGDPADGSGLEINDDGELDLEGREEDDDFSVHEVTKGSGDDSETIAKILSTADIELSSGVESVNSVTGAVNIIGGEHIEVSTDGQTIKISYNEDKEKEDPDPQDEDQDDDCGHPGDDDGGGGVNPDSDGGGGGAGGGASGGGGVSGGDDTHTGDNGCNCDQ